VSALRPGAANKNTGQVGDTPADPIAAQRSAAQIKQTRRPRRTEKQVFSSNGTMKSRLTSFGRVMWGGR